MPSISQFRSQRRETLIFLLSFGFQWVRLADEHVTLFPGNSNCTLDVAGKLFTVLRADEIDFILVSIEGLNAFSVLDNGREGARAGAGLEPTSDILVIHERRVVIEGIFKILLLLLFSGPEQLNNRLDKIFPPRFHFIRLALKPGLPLIILFAAMEEDHDATAFIRRRDIMAHIK